MKNSAGYSLVEVLVIAGILGISMLAWLSMAGVINDSSIHPDLVVERDSLTQLIRETLKYQSICNSALVGPSINASGFSQASILSGNQQIQMNLPGLITPGSSAANVLAANSTVRKLQVTGLKIVNAVDLGSGQYFAQIQVESRGAANGFQLKPIVTGSLFFTESGGAISACTNNITNPTPLCVEMGCNWNPAATPSCQCPPIAMGCPAQQFMTGIDSVGNPVCMSLGAGPCPAGEYLVGVGIGTKQCVPLP